MTSLQDRIVDRLASSFIVDRAIDPVELAKVLQKEFPGVAENELVEAVRVVANGIGVRVKDTP